MSFKADEIDQKYGKIIISWNFPEFEKIVKGSLWFIVLGLIAGLLLIFTLLTANFLFALIIVLVLFILLAQQLREPREINFTITENGIILDGYFYAFFEIENFWIIFEPPEVKNLYLKTKQTVSPIKKILLKDTNPLYIREILSESIEEDLEKQEENFTDILARILKL